MPNICEILYGVSYQIDWIALTAISSILLAGITAFYARETRKLVKIQTDPNIIVFVHHDEYRLSILQIVIENIGRGLAKNINFSSDKPIPNRAFGMEEKEAKDAELMSKGPLIKGIPALAPGEKRVLDWGQPGGLRKALKGGSINIVCQYENQQGKSVSPTFNILEIESFFETSAAEPYTLRMIKEAEKIRKALEIISQATTNLNETKQRTF